MSELIDVLQGTMRRRAQGSATEFNRQISDSLGDGSLLSSLARPDLIPRRLAGLVTNAGDAVRRVALGSNVRALATRTALEAGQALEARWPTNVVTVECRTCRFEQLPGRPDLPVLAFEE
ncbi:hypothetical protein [Mesorhizobium loti]|uniref:hypothetical protein n=1 Tax=Rhizobium loti TaxID=381 RepID=UPI000D6AD10E|nr:hypothetical protein [Mesorhizobium loti]